MYANSLLGVWPFIFEEHPNLRKLYNFYSRFTFTYYLIFIFTAYIQLCIILSEEVINVKDIFSNLSITLIYTVTILRVRSIKTTRVKTIIQEIFYTEDKIHASGDEKIIKIYQSYSRQSQISNYIFMVNIFLGKYNLLAIHCIITFS